MVGVDADVYPMSKTYTHAQPQDPRFNATAPYQACHGHINGHMHMHCIAATSSKNHACKPSHFFQYRMLPVLPKTQAVQMQLWCHASPATNRRTQAVSLGGMHAVESALSHMALRECNMQHATKRSKHGVLSLTATLAPSQSPLTHLVSKPKHHGRAHIKRVTLTLEVPCRPPWNEVPERTPGSTSMRE